MANTTSLGFQKKRGLVMKKICRVDMTKKLIYFRDLPNEYERLGGRGLSAKIILSESNPVCDPFGKHSLLIFATGLLAGTPGPAVNRISVGGKSPLTGTIKESNAGGITALRLSQLGLKAVIITGMAEEKKGPFVLHLSKDKAELITMPDLKYQGVYNTAEILKQRFEENCGMVIIGPAGERRFRAASVVHLDKDGIPGRFSGRGGLGSIMGSKGLKAIVISKGKHTTQILDKKLYIKAIKDFIAATKANKKTAEIFPKYGTAALVQMINGSGALPTRNYSAGQFEAVSKIDGDRLYQLITERRGEGDTTHSCMPGCPVHCSNVFPDKNGNMLVSPLEYETIAMLGANCGIADLDQIAELNRLCNDLGIDTIEAGGAIAVAMEAGEIEFGNFEQAHETLLKVRDNALLGKIIANGVKTTGWALGVKRIPEAKGQGFSGYDPRGTKTVGVTFALSPMGADHTGGTGMTTPNVDKLSPNGHVDNSRRLQQLYAGIDCIGICIIAAEAVTDRADIFRRLISSTYGWSPGVDTIIEIGKECLKMERNFNIKAGFTDADDDLPEFLREEPLPPHNTVFDISKDEMRSFYNF